MRAATARRARPRLHASSASANAKKNETVAASNQAPMPIAPATATIISRFMSGRMPMKPSSGITSSYPKSGMADAAAKSAILTLTRA